MIEFTLLRQQLVAKARPFVIWIIVWTALLLLFANVFNAFSKDAATNAKLFEQLPQGIFNAINIDPSAYLTKIEKFISGQFLFVYLLAGSIFSFSLGTNAIGKKIESRTIATLLTKPISRGRLYLAQYSTSAIFLAASGFVIGWLGWIIMNVLLKYQSDISSSYFFWLFFGSTLIFMTFAALGQLIGSLMNGGSSLQVGAGIIVVSWFISSLGEFAHIPTAIQMFSLFHYFNVPMLRDNFQLDTRLTIYLVTILLTLLTAGYFTFKKKDIYI